MSRRKWLRTRNISPFCRPGAAVVGLGIAVGVGVDIEIEEARAV